MVIPLIMSSSIVSFPKTFGNISQLSLATKTQSITVRNLMPLIGGSPLKVHINSIYLLTFFLPLSFGNFGLQEINVVLMTLIPMTIIHKINKWLRDLNSLIKHRSLVPSANIYVLHHIHIPLTIIWIKKSIIFRWLSPPRGPLKLNIDGVLKG